jgi:hypothetical protein
LQEHAVQRTRHTRWRFSLERLPLPLSFRTTSSDGRAQVIDVDT